MNSLEVSNQDRTLKSWASVMAAYLPALALMGTSLVFAGLAVHDRSRRAGDAPATLVPDLKASTLLSGRFQFDGAADAPYTLVEFGDYECPPCRHTQPLVEDALKQYGSKVKLDFRELPLTQIHPHAEAAALAAESGRPVGKFWILHDRLYVTNLSSPEAISKVLKAAGVALNTKAAQAQLSEDAALEKQLAVNSTPSFFLCRPDGSVLRLDGIESLGKNIH